MNNTNNTYDLYKDIYPKIDLENNITELEAQNKGDYYLVKCPNCGKKEAYIYKNSMNIVCNRKNKCNYQNTLWNYLKEKYFYSDKEVFTILCKMAGKSPSDLDQVYHKEVGLAERKSFIYQKANEIFIEELKKHYNSNFDKKGYKTLLYLMEGRKYTIEDIGAMEIGFYSSMNKIKGGLNQFDISEEELLECGLLRTDFENTNYITIPYRDIYGKIIGFITRCTYNENPENKYLLTKGLSKKYNLFNFYDALKQKPDTLIFVEGYLDALIMANRGINNVVAIGQSHISKEHIEIAIKHNIKYFILALDKDEAGYKGTEKAIKTILQNNCSPFVLLLPENYKDPDEYLKTNNLEHLKELISNPISGAKWYASRIISKYDIDKDIEKEKAYNEAVLADNIFHKFNDKKDFWNIMCYKLNINKDENESLLNKKRENIKTENILKATSTGLLELIKDNNHLEAKKLLLKNASVLENIMEVESILRPQYNFDDFITKHKSLLNAKGLKSGFNLIDKDFFFNLTDFNIIQSMSNHGKSSFMLNLIYNFLNNYSNVTCFFISYETSIERVIERFLNTIARKTQCNNIISYSEGEYTYAKPSDISIVKQKYNEWISKGNLSFQNNIPYEYFDTIIKSLKNNYPDNTIILFLDYIQIIANNISSDGWQRIKELAYGIEKLAVDNEIIVFSASQVNDKGETREGKDIYNSATNVFDIFNHSHAKIEDKPNYKEKEDNEFIISISIDKSKFFQTKSFPEKFRFDGFVFKENIDILSDYIYNYPINKNVDKETNYMS